MATVLCGMVNSHPCNNSAHAIHKAVTAIEECHSQNKSICSHQEYEPTFYLYLTCAAHKGCCINSKGPDKIGCNPRHLWILSPRNSKFISSFYRLHPLSCLGRVWPLDRWRPPEIACFACHMYFRIAFVGHTRAKS